MSEKKKGRSPQKSNLHPRNRHRRRYDFKLLIGTCPELADYVRVNDYGDESIDFFDPAAVKVLNKALLAHYYGVQDWGIPKEYLCPPIPGRADYIHYMADLLAETNRGKIPRGKGIRCLDIGVGANAVYPIIGCREYGWSFVGTDIDPVAIDSANEIVKRNPVLHGCVELRLQENPKHVFKGIIKKDEVFHLTICNPPFHASLEEAQFAARRKLRHLKQRKIKQPILNFSGKHNELWCEGGERKFISNIIRQSKAFADSCLWFSSLVSKESNLKSIYHVLREVGAAGVRTIPMGQGQKRSRVVAWRFL